MITLILLLTSGISKFVYHDWQTAIYFVLLALSAEIIETNYHLQKREKK